MIHQLPELYRRGIVRPLDKKANDALQAFHVESSIRCEWLPILGEDHFAIIWKSGIFQALNQACGVGLNDYEEVIINSDQVLCAINAVQKFLLHAEEKNCKEFAELLLNLLVDAKHAKMPVFFIL